MLLFTYFKNITNIFYVFNFILILAYFNILYLNEETIICIALIIFYFTLFFALKKIILIFFFFTSELLYLIFFFLLNINILYINIISKYIFLLFQLYFNNKKNIYFIFFKYNINLYIYSILYFKLWFKNFFKFIKLNIINNYLKIFYSFNKFNILSNIKTIDNIFILYAHFEDNMEIIDQYQVKYNNYKKIL
jgi:hypothetical protein